MSSNTRAILTSTLMLCLLFCASSASAQSKADLNRLQRTMNVEAAADYHQRIAEQLNQKKALNVTAIEKQTRRYRWTVSGCTMTRKQVKGKGRSHALKIDLRGLEGPDWLDKKVKLRCRADSKGCVQHKNTSRDRHTMHFQVHWRALFIKNLMLRIARACRAGGKA